MNRPLVTINIAMTADGKIDTYEREGAKISSKEDWIRVDRIRADSDAVMVGGRTLLGEDPRLTIKDPGLQELRISRGLTRDPIKVGVISDAKLSLKSRFIHDGSGPVIIFTTNRTGKKQIANLKSIGVDIILAEKPRVDLSGMMEILYQRGVRKLLVEGGGTLNAALLQDKLVDSLNIYIAPILFLGADAPTLGI